MAMDHLVDPGPVDVHEGRNLVLTVGIVLVILGVLAMLAPLITGVAITLLMGVLLLAGGIARCMFAFRARSWGAGALGVGLGFLATLVGFLLLFFPRAGLETLTVFLAAYFLVHGIFEIAFAFRLKPRGGWLWTAASGLVSVVLGVLIWMQWPVSGVWAVGILAGVNLMVGGLALVLLALSARPRTTTGPTVFAT